MTSVSLPDVAVMLSVGRHPVSHRARASHADRRATGIAQRANFAHVIGVHGGSLESEVAYDFFAMGLSSIQVLEQVEGDDPLPTLMSWWRNRKPSITLFGDKAEQGESTGMLPYFFAEKLRLPLISGVISITASPDQFEVVQALSATSRRQIMVRPPFVGVSSARSPVPLRFSHTAARQSHSEFLSLTPLGGIPTWVPALVNTVTRPMSLRSDIGVSLEQRLSALMGGDRRVRQRYSGTSSAEAARLITAALKSLGLWMSNR